MPIWRQTYFIAPQTSIALSLYNYHNCVIVLGRGIVALVTFSLFILIIAPYKLKWGVDVHITEHNIVEFFWTIIPFFLLIVFCFFSLNNLSKMELGDKVEIKVGVVGHQWYWEYQYILNIWQHPYEKCDFIELFNEIWEFTRNRRWWGWRCNWSLTLEESTLRKQALYIHFPWALMKKGEWIINYESYMVDEEDLSLASGSLFRNIDVSQPCLMGTGLKHEIRIITADVMHSWGVPAFAAKADAVPGRTNRLSVKPMFPGMVYGFCYELCGQGHSTMPIGVMVLDLESITWLLKTTLFNTHLTK
jgi:heme/copper-type cytochrome/quinol oxidase subunit 2